MIIDPHWAALAVVVWLAVDGGVLYSMALAGARSAQAVAAASLWPLVLLLSVPGATRLIVLCLPVALTARWAARSSGHSVRLADGRVMIARESSLRTVEGVWFLHGEGQRTFRMPLLWCLAPTGLMLARLHAGRTRIAVVGRDGGAAEARALRLGGTILAKLSDLHREAACATGPA